MYVCMYVCIYIYTYIYICLYVHTCMYIYIWRERGSIHIYLYKLYIASNHILLSILVLAVFRTLVLVTCGRKVV
jgi:hypothetical protein